MSEASILNIASFYVVGFFVLLLIHIFKESPRDS